MKILLKCWTPDWYDSVSHAILEIDLPFVEKLLAHIRYATELHAKDIDLMGLQYDDYSPEFIDLGDPSFCGLSEEEASYCDDGHLILPDSFTSETVEFVSMRPVMMMVMGGRDGRIYWYGYDKHGGPEYRAETYLIYPHDLEVWKKCLNSNV